MKAAYGAEGGARRRIYRQSQAEQPTSSAPVKQVASFVVPAGVFVAATFGMDFRLFPLCLFFTCGCLIWKEVKRMHSISNFVFFINR